MQYSRASIFFAFIANSEKVEFFAGREGLVFHGSGGMHGGYPNATSYRLQATDTNLEEIFRNKQDYPISDNDPYNGEFERLLEGNISRKPIGTIYPISLENYDIIHFAESGGPGYGDPLERKIESVKQDLDDGFYTADIVKNVYGVVANFDDKSEEWIINNEATKDRREEIRQERKDKSITFDEFWEKEKKRITEGDLYEAVSVMYSESLKLSARWGKMFREFWKFPEDFQIEVKK